MFFCCLRKQNAQGCPGVQWHNVDKRLRKCVANASNVKTGETHRQPGGLISILSFLKGEIRLVMCNTLKYSKLYFSDFSHCLPFCSHTFKLSLQIDKSSGFCFFKKFCLLFLSLSFLYFYPRIHSLLADISLTDLSLFCALSRLPCQRHQERENN